MLFETRLDEKTQLFIDAETAGGFAKDEAGNDFHPDDALDNVVAITSAIASKMSEIAARSSQSMVTPAGIDLSFGVKVQGDAVVCIAKRPDDGQFQVTVRWS